jgi:osmotically-inducible protein OsmY
MKSDEQIRLDVETELRWCSGIDATDIAVSVRAGVATLSGYARNYYEKSEAEAAAKRIVGAAAVADDIHVRLPDCSGLTDPEIARAVIEALKLIFPRMWQAIQPIVHDSNVTLEGTVDWTYERVQAEGAVRRVRGVRGVTNRIGVVNDLPPENIKDQIAEAFRRRADLDASHVSVETHGADVKLTGEVGSLAERDVALAIASAAQGVSTVKNELVVRP